MSENQTSEENNNTNPLQTNNKARNKKIALIIGVLFVLGLIIIPRVWAKFNKKEVVCLNNQTQIYEKYKDAVVLVKHTYALQISIKGSEPFQIAVDDSSLGEKTISGTGFFVSEDGKIVTNHHVAEPWKYTESKNEDFGDLKDHIASILPDSIDKKDYKTYLESHWNDYYDEEGEGDYSEEEAAAENNAPIANVDSSSVNSEVNDLIADNKTEEKAVTSQITYTNLEDIKIVPKTVEISIALHGSKDNWLQCKVFKIADGDEVDVAVLQLISESLPASVSDIVDLDDAVKDDASIKPGTNAILIGYPMGLQLANTRRGIKVQVYEGQINKESDGVSVQYNVTSTHGASGSPVFNECGQLIAINYAGYDEAQGYNFGIVAKHAMSLME
ncbi:serine protease Do [Flavobacterium sp. 103]|uniref:S1 family peptidase n=1 Tax=unclassified Flavobacterium TaxID=196869 RepID=UPI000D5F0279|nr:MULTISPECIES: serine protease [unclassified Flavobacterium]PVX47841.1 serine protease Do [Flavobacterium sp. 103]QKJ63659.1 serine protease [Flavobacterium sp. M31R6]